MSYIDIISDSNIFWMENKHALFEYDIFAYTFKVIHLKSSGAVSRVHSVIFELHLFY